MFVRLGVIFNLYKPELFSASFEKDSVVIIPTFVKFLNFIICFFFRFAYYITMKC